jgi:hypothetical protein
VGRSAFIFDEVCVTVAKLKARAEDKAETGANKKSIRFALN